MHSHSVEWYTYHLQMSTHDNVSFAGPIGPTSIQTKKKYLALV